MLERKSESSFAQIKSKIKVVFLGEQSTGKTSILMRFIHDKFQQGLGPTIGIDFMAKNLHIGTNILRMQLWDTAGQERFRSLIPSYLKDALIAFIVFDLTNQKSFDNLNQWIDLCHNNKKQKTVLVLLGNKADLQDMREVDSQKVRQKIEETSLPYFQVSAKTGSNVKQAFHFAGNEYFNAHIQSQELSMTTLGPEKSRTEPIPQQKQQKAVHNNGHGSSKQKKGKSAKMISLNNQQIKLQGQGRKEKKKKGCC